MEPNGLSKGLGRKTKALGKVPTPSTIREMLLAGEGGPGIFVFSAADLWEEGAVSVQELSLDIGALGEEGPSV